MDRLSTSGLLSALLLELFSMRPFMPWVGCLNYFLNRAVSQGATHEMMRADRDLHVKILFENIEPGFERNFKNKGTDLYSARDTPFDYDSIMIYGSRDYGVLDSTGQRMNTIQPLMQGVEIK